MMMMMMVNADQPLFSIRSEFDQEGKAGTGTYLPPDYEYFYEPKNDRKIGLSQILAIITLVLWVYQAIREIEQYRGSDSCKHYFWSIWTFLDWI